MNFPKFDLLNRQRPSGVLGLALDGNRLQGVVLRRTNGSAQVVQSFSIALSLDPLTNAPELVGREIRNHLESAGVRERRCVVAVPLKWALTVQTAIPALPEAELASFLQIEAERGFPCDADTLILATSRCHPEPGEDRATLVGIPRHHLVLLEEVLKAAHLKPLSFALGITALQPSGARESEGVLTLAIGETHVGLLVTCGGGLAALRTLDGAVETEGGQTVLGAELVAREVRITLGQLPASVRQTVRRIRIAGPEGLGRQLLEELRPRVEPLGMQVDLMTGYSPAELGIHLPAETPVSPAASLAARFLGGRRTEMEFLPPKTNRWQQLTTRYSSRKLVWAGTTAAAIALLILAAFVVQQWQLSRLRSQWTVMAPKVKELEVLQQQTRQFRPWFDNSFRSLSILRRLTEAFPEDGVVTAKTVEIREPSAITCVGSARDSKALYKTLDLLRATREISDVKVEQLRAGTGLQFTFNFHWAERGINEH